MKDKSIGYYTRGDWLEQYSIDNIDLNTWLSAYKTRFS